MTPGRTKAEEVLSVMNDIADDLLLEAGEAAVEEFWRTFSRGINKQFYARWGEAKARRKAAQREAAERDRLERLRQARSGSWVDAIAANAEQYLRSADELRERNRILFQRLARPTIRAAVRETERGFGFVEGAPVYIDDVQVGTIQSGGWEGTIALPPIGCDCDASSSSTTATAGTADRPTVPADSSSGSPPG